jgi:hypothetical protein
MPKLLLVISWCARTILVLAALYLAYVALLVASFYVDAAVDSAHLELHGSWLAAAQVALLLASIAVVAYTLTRLRPWSREAILFLTIVVVASFFIPAAASGDPDRMSVAIGAAVATLAATGWYLYRKRAVRTYYADLWREWLRRHEAPGARGGAP